MTNAEEPESLGKMQLQSDCPAGRLGNSEVVAGNDPFPKQFAACRAKKLPWSLQDGPCPGTSSTSEKPDMGSTDQCASSSSSTATAGRTIRSAVGKMI